jgi:hypothetical protein
MTNLAHGPTFTDADVRTDLPTRDVPIKWVTLVDAELNRGLVVNAAACTAAAVGRAIPAVIGPGGEDAVGTYHPGLAWIGCSVLAGTATSLKEIRAKAITKQSVLVVDMVAIAQQVRVYDGYLERLAKADEPDLNYLAVSLVGPRNVVDKLVGGLSLLQ